MSRRAREMTKTTVTRNKRLVTVVRVQREVVTTGPVYVAFGNAVRERRLQLGMTQEVLADKIGISRTSIVNIEAARQRVLLGDVFDFAAALDMKPSKLFAAVAADNV